MTWHIRQPAVERFIEAPRGPRLLPRFSLARGNAVIALGILSGAVRWLLTQRWAG